MRDRVDNYTFAASNSYANNYVTNLHNMIDDTKPKSKIILGKGTQVELADKFNMRRASICNYLSGRCGTPRAREIRLYALNEMDGRYINVVKPQASH